MVKVIGVRFKSAGKIYYFDPGEFEFENSDHAIVETVRGVEYGQVVIAPRDVDEKDIVKPLKQVVRKATRKDQKKEEENKQKEKEAFDICLQKIQKHNMEMKLIDVEYTFDNNKIIFYFTADNRVDFRELVKDLASVFRIRIELRQIGVRDESKMVGGLGPCGRVACCCSHLGEFQPVSIKMAKEQSLSLSPTKISGLCGRLMCCLNYEQEQYETVRKKMPKIGSEVKTPDGMGTVMDNNVLSEVSKVKITLPDNTAAVREYHISALGIRITAADDDAAELPIDEEIKSLLDE